MTSIDPRQFRQLMGHFATGVCVVTTEVGGEVRALTVNSFTSVSLDPLLVLWCLDKRTRLAEHIHELTGYGVSILSAAQQDLSSYFAGQFKDRPAPPHTFQPMPGGARLEGCIGALGCRLVRVDEGGDHWILLGRVEELYFSGDTRDPLIWFGGRYRGLSA
ncbi:MAG: flavin reductase family protein [Anaerolineales bacterium]|nr:flavin reductase family protein [Anaerolineales bacterium]